MIASKRGDIMAQIVDLLGVAPLNYAGMNSFPLINQNGVY